MYLMCIASGCSLYGSLYFFFFVNDTATTEIYTLSLHDALPIFALGALSDTTGTGTGGSDGWSFSAQDQSFDYLAAGEIVTLTYTVQVADNHGGSTTQDVTVTITGTNDAPVVTSAAQTGSITELSGTLGST